MQAVVDAACFLLGAAAADALVGSPLPQTGAAAPGVRMVALAAVGLVALRVRGAYRSENVATGRSQTGAVLSGCSLGALLALAGAKVLAPGLSSVWLVLSIALGGILVAIARRFNNRASLRKLVRRETLVRRTILVGGGDEAVAVARALREHRDLGFKVIGSVGDRHLSFGIPWLGRSVDDIPSAAATFEAEAVFVVPTGLSGSDLRRLRRVMASYHVDVYVLCDLSGVTGSRLIKCRIGDERVAYVELQRDLQARQVGKRAFDLVVGSVLIVATMPLMLLIGALVLVRHGRPILFRQTRIGRDLEPFTMFKFRTMVPDAEARKAWLSSSNERSGPLFKLTNDPRVTSGLGRFLRRSSLDELPQLFNVLKGDMSLVGPRPALPAETREFNDELQSRHRVRPGITGLWQIRARDDARFEPYERYDLIYVENWTIRMDLAILGLTLPSVLARSFRRKQRPWGSEEENAAVPDGVESG